MSNRLGKFFSKELKENFQHGKSFARKHPGWTAVLGGLTAMATVVNPLAPEGIAGFVATNKSLEDDHSRLVKEIKAAHERGEALGKYRTNLKSFSPDRIKDYYSRGSEDEKAARKGRNILTGAGVAAEIACDFGVGAAVNGVQAYFMARDRNRLIDRLERDGGTPPAPGA